MAKTLLVVVQSKNIDVYVNVLTHCVRNLGVQDIYFVGRKEEIGKDFELLEFIRKIRDRTTELAEQHEVYGVLRDILPRQAQLESRILRIVFVSPQHAISDIKRRFPSLDELLVDITGCDKRLANDVMTSFLASGITHVCHFQLADKVFAQDWRQSNKSLLFHDLEGEILYYQYDDFSSPGTTISTLNHLRAQGRLIRLLIVLSVVLGFAVVVLLNRQQATLAQIAALVLALVTGLGFLEDSFSLFERFRR